MYVDVNTIITIGAVITALGIIIGAVFALFNWLNKQKKQDIDIKKINKEMTLLVYCMRACLDGLEQLGANHTVPVAKDKLEKYINLSAHEQEE